MSNVLREILPLSEKDCFYIVERHKNEFDYPIHSHREYELNFIENGAGVRRIVGDSMEEIGPYDLTLIAGSGLEHMWAQGSCSQKDVREITIQFSPDLLGEDILSRNQFLTIKHMFERATMGLSFSMPAIMRVYSLLDGLASMQERFEQYLASLKILYELSLDDGSRTLASSSFSESGPTAESRRVQKVKAYIDKHYPEVIRLEDLASIAGMSPSAFSRFFKQHTRRTPVDYIIDVRLGQAARQLVDSSDGISEICFACGFGNLSNFNRTFKLRRGSTPSEFRSVFKKQKVIV